MEKLLDPHLLVRIYFTTLQHKNIHMIHGMRSHRNFAMSCNKFCIPQKFVRKFIHIYVSRPCTMCLLLIHILLHHVDPPSRLLRLEDSLARTLAASLAPNVVPCSVGVAGALPPSQTVADPPTERLAAPSLCSFSSVYLMFFYFRTISLGHSELTESSLS